MWFLLRFGAWGTARRGSLGLWEARLWGAEPGGLTSPCLYAKARVRAHPAWRRLEKGNRSHRGGTCSKMRTKKKPLDLAVLQRDI